MTTTLETIHAKRCISTRMITMLTVICLMAVLLTVPAFAEDGAFTALENAGKSVLHKIWDLLQAITAPLALVYIGGNVVYALIAGGKSMEKSKENIIRTLFAIGVIFLAPLFVTTVTGALSGLSDESTQAIFGTN